MRLIDTHCHLIDSRLAEDLPGVLERARSGGVVAMICAAADIADSQAAAELAGQYRQVYCLSGVHPHNAQAVRDDYLSRLETLSAGAKNVAIGEIGLDYHYDFSPRDAQQRVFAGQLALAERLGKAVVVHTREALDDTLAIIADAGAGVRRIVFHSFTGGPDETRRALDTGAWISYSGIATFDGADSIRSGAAIVPDGRIMIETDAPYLSPEPVRKIKTNEPANVAHVARRLAAVRGTAVEDFAGQTAANASGFFHLDRF